MPDINVLQPLEVQPNRNVLQLGQRPQTLTFFLRAYPPPMIVQVPGGPSAVSGVLLPPPVSRIAQPIVRPGPRALFVQSSPAQVLPAGLVHARALGTGPRLSPQARLTGIVHTRAQGGPLVIPPPPVIPPVIPPPVPVSPVSSPRNLRAVRRRNEEERD